MMSETIKLVAPSVVHWTSEMVREIIKPSNLSNLPIGIPQEFFKPTSECVQFMVILVPQYMSMIHLEGLTFTNELFEVLHPGDR